MTALLPLAQAFSTLNLSLDKRQRHGVLHRLCVHLQLLIAELLQYRRRLVCTQVIKRLPINLSALGILLGGLCNATPRCTVHQTVGPDTSAQELGQRIRPSLVLVYRGLRQGQALRHVGHKRKLLVGEVKLIQELLVIEVPDLLLMLLTLATQSVEHLRDTHLLTKPGLPELPKDSSTLHLLTSAGNTELC